MPGIFGSTELRTLGCAPALLIALCGCTGSGTAGPAFRIEAVSGDGQSAISGTSANQPLVVKASDVTGKPAADVRVLWEVVSGAGGLSAASTQTGPDGTASVVATAGKANASNVFRARSGTLIGSPVTFTLSGISSAAARLSIASGDNQTSAIGAQVTLAVKATDRNDNPVQGVTVAWAGGFVAAPTSITGSDGTAAIVATLGAGVNTFTATAAGLSGSPIAFTASGVTAAGASAIAVSAGNNQAGVISTQLGAPLAALVTDPAGVPVSGVTVSWAGTSGGASVASATSVTNANGVAVVTASLGAAGGRNTWSATVAGIAPAQFSGLAADNFLISGDFQSGLAGVLLPRPFTITIIGGQPPTAIPDFPVTWVVTGGGGHFISATGPVMTIQNRTDSAGQASVQAVLGLEVTNTYLLTLPSPFVPRVLACTAIDGGIAPRIITGPADRTVTAGQDATFSVVATGPAIIFQWERSTGGAFTSIPGATTATLLLPSVPVEESGHRFRVVLRNLIATVTSNSALLTVNPPLIAPAFTTQPANVTITQGQVAQFTVVATGSPPPALQWQLSTDTGATWNDLAGETGTTYTASNVALADDGHQFRAAATNSVSTVHSNSAILTVNAPVVTTYPVGGTVTGLAGTGLVLQDNGADDRPITFNGPFTFATPVVAGFPYSVSVLSQPSGSTCTVQNATGNANAPVTDIAVTCTPNGPLALVTNSGVTDGSNGLSVYRVNPSTGALSFLNNVNSGNTPSAIAISPNRLYAYVANQVGGTVSSYRIDNLTGLVSPIPLSSPQSLNASGIAMDRLGRYIWVANFGFNTVSTFAIGAGNGVLTPVAGSPLATTALPFAITAHPTMDFVYAAHQDSSFSVTVYSVNAADGTLARQQSLTNVIASANGIATDPGGRFAYVCGTGVCAFAINASTGLLTSRGCARTSGDIFGLAVHPNGQYLYVVNDSTTDNVLVFAINQTTGALTPVGSPVSAGRNPRGVTVNAAGTFAYVTNYLSNDVSAFSISADGGTLTSLPLGATVAAGSRPQGIAVSP